MLLQSERSGPTRRPGRSQDCCTAMKSHKAIVLPNPSTLLYKSPYRQCSADRSVVRALVSARSTVDTALEIYRQLRFGTLPNDCFALSKPNFFHKIRYRQVILERAAGSFPR